jgi:hypothetical protein
MPSHTNLPTGLAVGFLKLLDPTAQKFTFQVFEDRANKTGNPPARVIHSWRELLHDHALGAGAYVTINETDLAGRKAENIKRIRATWQEDDDGFAGTFPLEPSLVVESSPQHFHRYWLTADNWPADEQGRKDFDGVMQCMVENYGSDKNAKDICRVLRLPGFLHRKNGTPHLVRIIANSGKRYTRAEIIAAFPAPVRKEKPASSYQWHPQHDDDEQIRDAIFAINADDRLVWRDIGMALKDHFGDSGRALWDQWSKTSTKHNEREQDRAWRSFVGGKGITIGTLFHYAKLAGWEFRKQSSKETKSGPKRTGQAGETESIARTAILVRADSLKPESISWAWRNRFAFGKMAMIAGDPGLGKSTILVDIVATHSRGAYFPCGEGKATLCDSVFLTAEDGLRDTLVPRLIAAEADMSKIHFLTGTKTEGANDEVAMFDITRDIAALRKVFEQNPEIKILVIDPLTAYLGSGTKAKENSDVRRVLTPLIKLIEEFGVLLLANNHLNKSGGKALYRVLDSIAFVALGRTIHLVVADAEIPHNRKVICDKSNIGSKPLGLTYIIQQHWIKGEQGEEIETSRISWGTKHIDETADEALNPETGETTSTELAVEFLRTVLAKGRVAVHDIESEARQAGLLGETQRINLSKPFRSACDDLHVVKTRQGFGPGGGWYWSLPETSPIGAPIDATSNTRAPMEGQGAYGSENTTVTSKNEAAGAGKGVAQPPLAPSNAIGALTKDEANMMAPMENCGAELPEIEKIQPSHDGNGSAADDLPISPFLQRAYAEEARERGEPPDELLEQLAQAKKVRRNAIRKMRRIYYGAHPCAERDKNPAFDAACLAAERATSDYNTIVDQINQERQRRECGEPPGRMAANGFAISRSPEDRKPPAPGQITCRVWIKEVRPPALGPPGDDLNDFVR